MTNRTSTLLSTAVGAITFLLASLTPQNALPATRPAPATRSTPTTQWAANQVHWE